VYEQMGSKGGGGHTRPGCGTGCDRRTGLVCSVYRVQNKLGSQLTGAIVSTYNMGPGRAQVGIRRGEVCPSIMSWLLIPQ
jgi:hypothetical protein